MIAVYFSIGVGMYLGLCLNNPKSFTSATVASLLRGLLLGIPFWPVGMAIKIAMIVQAGAQDE